MRPAGPRSIFRSRPSEFVVCDGQIAAVLAPAAARSGGGGWGGYQRAPVAPVAARAVPHVEVVVPAPGTLVTLPGWPARLGVVRAAPRGLVVPRKGASSRLSSSLSVPGG